MNLFKIILYIGFLFFLCSFVDEELVLGFTFLCFAIDSYRINKKINSIKKINDDVINSLKNQRSIDFEKIAQLLKDQQVSINKVEREITLLEKKIEEKINNINNQNKVDDNKINEKLNDLNNQIIKVEWSTHIAVCDSCGKPANDDQIFSGDDNDYFVMCKYCHITENIKYIPVSEFYLNSEN